MKKGKDTINMPIGKMITTIILLLVAILEALFSYKLLKIDLIPMKYLVPILVLLIFSLCLFTYYIFKGKNKVIKGILFTVMTFMAGFSTYLGHYIDNTSNFLAGTQISKTETLDYSVIVLNSSNYETIEDLANQKIGYLSIDEHMSEFKEKLNISYSENIQDDFDRLVKSLLNNKLDAIVLDRGRLAIAEIEIDGFKDKTKVIYTFDIEIERETDGSNDGVNILDKPFILYISGIDQYGTIKSVRGRSDVNQMVVVNPKTHKILLVNTPRDYYVQLHNTTGLRDKLTHAGIYGIDKSLKTLEDLYDTKIDYYMRVNFNTLVNVVDVIGGIDVYSDKAFRALTNRNVYVKKGLNHFNGAQALAYSRERYAYTTGDHHRGANQQQVITAIIEKMTSSEVLINKYNEILNTLNGTFQTSLSTDSITSIIRHQIDKMPKWTIESYAVTGSGSMDYTYSMGTNQRLYVMEPNLESVSIAKEKIKGLMNE